MTEPDSATRPRQVTMAAWVGGAASAAMLLTVGDVMSRLHTVDLRQSVSDFLATGSGTSVGVSLDQALVIARIDLMVTGAASAATLVFAVFASRRDKSARIAMSVLAVPLLVCGVFVDPFLAGFIAASAVLLWTRPAADWFAGRTPRPAPEPPAPSPVDRSAPMPPPPTDRTPPSSTSPPPGTPPPAPSPFASSYGAPTAAPVPPPAPSRPGPYAQPPAHAPGHDMPRPRQVVTACMIALAGSALVALVMVGCLFALQSQQVLDGMRTRIQGDAKLSQVNMSFDDLVATTRVVVALALVWAVGAMVLAVLAYRRQNWARIALAVSAVGAGLLGLVATISFLGFFLVSAASLASTVLLFHRDASRWFAGAVPESPGRPPHQPPSRPW